MILSEKIDETCEIMKSDLLLYYCDKEKLTGTGDSCDAINIFLVNYLRNRLNKYVGENDEGERRS